MKLLIKKYKKILMVICIPYVVIVFSCIVRTNNEVLLTGDLTEINSLIEINTDYEKSGSFNSVFVINFRRATLFQTLLLKASPVNEVLPISPSTTHLSQTEINRRGSIQHDYAKETSIILAYNNASNINPNINLDYNQIGIIVNFYEAGETQFQIGDIIYKINDISIFEDPELFLTNLKQRQKGDTIFLTRGNKSIEIEVTEEFPPIFGVPKYEIRPQTSNPTLIINSSMNRGSSAGLLQTLSNFNALLPTDFSLGKKIAGTGTISIDGKVGEIGGVKQKIFTAYRTGADIFFVPKDNEEEALEAYSMLKNKEKMQLVIVSTFEEALEYLISCML